MVSLARIIKWEIGTPGAFDRPRSLEEIMAKLEERIGPEGRKLFEQFLKKVNKLGAPVQCRATAIRGLEKDRNVPRLRGLACLNSTWGVLRRRPFLAECVAHHVAGDVGSGEFLAQLVKWPTIIVGDGNDVAHRPTHAWQLSLHNNRLAVADQ
jgi:hypothetical protein